MKTVFLILIFIVELMFPASCARAAEKDYQIPWCNEHQGIAEHVLSDRSRVDCLTETHAIEVDYSRKWAEAIGQSLFYAAMTGKKPGIVLIVNGSSSMAHIMRLQKTVEDSNLPIRVWLVEQ